MKWIEHVKTLPRPELKHDPSIQDVYGKTCMMYWIKYVKTLPPSPELMYDPALQDNDGKTCADMLELLNLLN